MRFSPQFLDEIRSRVPVSDVVGRRVKLRKEGREWRGLSPFNTERTPSFYVNDQKMAWYDFSAGRNGNIFDFVMATEGLSFPEAVERLAAEAGLPLPRRTPEEAEKDQRRAGLTEACEWAAQYFERVLASADGERARAYLAGRGLSPAVQQSFRLGYATRERHALRDHLAGRGVPLEVMTEGGLLVHGEDIAVPYDRFRDRIMFPIADRGGRVIAFGGRALDKAVAAKYLNSPETPLFHKGGILYNHHRARRVAPDKGTVIVVEGYVDAIALTAADHPNVVAPLGTALTGDQCGLLWRMADEPVLCFDGDAAGRRAAFKAVDTALPLLTAGHSLRFAFLPDGQDPDDLARGGGAAAVAGVLAEARPLADVLWMREAEAHPLDTPERRAGFEKRLRERVTEIRDEAVRRHYGAEMQARLRALLDGPARVAAGFRGGGALPGSRGRGLRGRFGAPDPHRGLAGAPLPGIGRSLSRSHPLAAAALPPREVLIVALVLSHPALLDWHAEDLAHLEFTSAAVSGLRDALLRRLDDHATAAPVLAAALDTAGYGELRRRIGIAAARLPHWTLKADTAESDADQEIRQAMTLHRKAGVLHKALRAAEVAMGEADTEQNFAALLDARERLSAFEGTEAAIEGFGVLSGRTTPDL